MNMNDSKLSFYCVHCGEVGSRNDSYRALPKQVPGYVDVCPVCESTDVEVYDPKYSGPGQDSEFADTAASAFVN